MATLKELKYGGGWSGRDFPTVRFEPPEPAKTKDVFPAGETKIPAKPTTSTAATSTGKPTGRMTMSEFRDYLKETGGSLSGSFPVGGRSAAGGGGGAPSRTTVTTRRSTMPMPEAPAVPAFKAPEWDKKKIGRLAQKKAAPRLRALRRQMEREAGRQYENPNVKRMTLRQAMEGYGLGIGSVVSEAEAAGRAEYGQEYAREFAGAQTTYAAQTQAMMQSYQAAFNAYLQSMKQVTTTGPAGEKPGEVAKGGWRREDFGPAAWAKYGSKLAGVEQRDMTVPWTGGV